MRVATERSGRGVSIALIDSGVDASHPALARALVDHVAVVPRVATPALPGGFVVEAAPSGDVSGHGTACAGILHRMVPEARIVSVRALGPDGRCSRDALAAALRYAVSERFPVVNLSLGIDVPRGAPLRPTDHKSILELYEIADAAYTAGVVLVASGPNIASLRTYPGRFKSLIGVGRGGFVSEDGLRTELTADYEIVAPGNDVVAPALGGGERRWTGTSFSCPHVAAHVARLRAFAPELTVEAVRAALHVLAKNESEVAHATA